MAVRPCLFVWTVILLITEMMGDAGAASHINYTTVTGFFLQDDPRTNPSTFDYTTENFGLINQTYDTDARFDPYHDKTPWQRFEHKVKVLNQECGKNTQYKVLYMGRHGQGLHNVAEDYYGTEAWDCYWSLKDGNGTVTWADAHLTESGIQQAKVANNFWATELEVQKIPAPQKYYVSPLFRCLATADITFKGLDLPKGQPFVPTIKELLRETIGIHTCDRRSSRTYIHSNYPTYPFERNFAEDDPLWSATYRETDSAQTVRMKALLDDIFTSTSSTWISFTTHSGAIAAILRAIGHRTFSLTTGAVIPVLVKAEIIAGSAPEVTTEPWTTVATCTALEPTTSSTSISAPALVEAEATTTVMRPN
ncbi:MAG: hypothetical protein M1834_001349 [Cirrosporium novae-zelandiae]|nr:MAG: hypothetical protein M1834_001349 [Cirrosporium novae-zelandiae]